MLGWRVAAFASLAIPSLSAAESGREKVKAYEFSEIAVDASSSSLVLPIPMLAIPTVKTPPDDPLLAACDALEAKLENARKRTAAGAAALRAELGGATSQTELLAESMKAERALGRCLEQAASAIAPDEIADLRALRQARFLAVIAAPERRDPERARAIVQRLSIRSSEECETPNGAYLCGWKHLARGDGAAAFHSFQRARERAGDGPMKAAAEGAAASTVARTETLPLEAPFLAMFPPHEQTRARRLLAEAMRLAGRLDESAELLFEVAAGRPPGAARCLTLRTVARRHADGVAPERAVAMLEHALEDLDKTDAEECERGLADDFRAMATQWHREGRKTRSEETAKISVRAYTAFLERFPDSLYAYDLAFYRAELLWARPALASADELAAAYEAVLEANPVGPWSRETIDPIGRSLQRMLKAEEVAPALVSRVKRFLGHAERLGADELDPYRAIFGKALIEKRHPHDGATLLAQAIGSNPAEYGGFAMMVFDAWNRLGAYGPLHDFMEQQSRIVARVHSDLADDLEQLRPLVHAKRCELDPEGWSACLRALAELHAGTPFAERANELAVQPPML